jgi:hypothetical protein
MTRRFRGPRSFHGAYPQRGPPKIEFASKRLTGTPYALPPAQAKLFRSIADQKCFRCKGTGVSKWRRGGTLADVCRCVQTRIPAIQAALEEQQKRLMTEVEIAKVQEAADKAIEDPLPSPATPEEIAEVSMLVGTEPPNAWVDPLIDLSQSVDSQPVEVPCEPVTTYEAPAEPAPVVEVPSGSPDGGAWTRDGSTVSDL